MTSSNPPQSQGVASTVRATIEETTRFFHFIGTMESDGEKIKNLLLDFRMLVEGLDEAGFPYQMVGLLGQIYEQVEGYVEGVGIAISVMDDE